MVKTSVKIPDDLWEAAKVRAAQERKDLAMVISESLAAHLRPRQFSSEQLKKAEVSVISESGVWLRCDSCKQTWSPNLRAGGKLPPGYWKCPKGCNAGSVKGESHAR